MAFYDVYRKDGTITKVDAPNKEAAYEMVRKPEEKLAAIGSFIIKAVEVKEPTPTPTPTPTTPTPTTPTPTTPSPTAPTTTPTGAPTSTVSPELEKLILEWVSLVGGWGVDMFTVSGDQTILTAGGEGFLSTVMTYAQREGVSVTPEQIQYVMLYQDYLAYQKDNPFMPLPDNVNDYILHYEQWLGNQTYYQMGYTQEQIDNFDRFSAFASQYGDLNDFQPKDLADFLANYDQAQKQLDTWVQEAGPEAAGFTDDQVQEYYAFRDYQSAYGEPGEWKPVDIGHFFSNYETAQQQLDVWKQQAGEVEKYDLDPGEAAGRREEAYTEGRYAAKERYWESPKYQGAAASWLAEQRGFSSALLDFTKSEYPSMVSQFEAEQPRLTGFPTREAAREEAATREQKLQAWLTGQTPSIREKYWTQRPAERGERLWMQAPGLRTANW